MTFVIEEQIGAVRVLTMDHPETLNALTVDRARELGERLEAAGADAAVRAVALTGAGAAFSSGGDMSFLEELPTMPPERAREVVYGTFQRPVRAIRSMPKPVIAVVNGPAVGAGCELAVAADFRWASEWARFGEVWIKAGCVPALGGMYLLPRLIGLARATEMIMTGQIIGATDALAMGLVNRVLPLDQLLDDALTFASALAAGPAHALAVAKAALDRGLSSTFVAELEATAAAQVTCFGSPDFAEGVRALRERRAPRFGAPAPAGRRA